MHMPVTKHTAYVILFIALAKDGQPPTVEGAAVFSEPSPTINLNKHRLVVLFEVSAASSGEALERAEEQLKSSYYNWCGRLQCGPRGWHRDARVAA